MSDLARDLTLNFHWRDLASGPAGQFFEAEKRRIREVRDEQEKSDQAYVRAIYKHLAAQKQLATEQKRAIDEIARERTRAEEKAQREIDASFRRGQKEQLAEARAAAKERAAADVRAAKERMAAEKQASDAAHQWAMHEWEVKQELAAKQKAMWNDLKTAGIAVAGAVGAAWIQSMRDAAESVREARDHIKGMTEEMEGARKGDREIAALRGQKPTAMFSAQLAREAGAVGLSPDEYKQAALAFEAHAGQYVGGEETGDVKADTAALEKAGKRVTRDQSLRLQQKVAGYAVGARGLGADEAMRLLGVVIAKSKANATDDEIMGQYARAMKSAELAPGRTSPIVGQIAELAMESVGPEGDFKSVEQGTSLVRVMAQRNPNEASTYGRALLRGLREVRQDPAKMAELGIVKGMDINQQLIAVDKAVKAHVAGGGDQGEFLSKYFKDIREWGAVSTAINEGIRGGGFQRIQGEMAGVNAETARKETIDYLGSEEGRTAKDKSEEIAITRERSAYYNELRHMQREARHAIITGGELEIPEGQVESFLTRRGEEWGQGGRFEQTERAEVGRMLRERLSGSREGRKWLFDHSGGAVKGLRGTERERAEVAGKAIFNRATDEKTLADAANALKRIADQAERQRAMPNARPPMAQGNGVR